MSLTGRTYLLSLLLLLVASSSVPQVFSDQGLMSGSGMTILPSANTTPSSEIRASVARIDFLRRDQHGLNVAGLYCGLSTHLEAYVRITGEQRGTISSLTSYTFGGKFRSPVEVKPFRQIALWMESSATDAVAGSALNPPSAFRTGITGSLGGNGITPLFFAGVTSIDHAAGPLLGAGITVAAGNRAQFGFEFMHGYAGRSTTYILANASVRVISNIGIQVGPGYASGPSVSTWVLSLGLSFSTADIDFHPVRDEAAAEEFKLPSIEEIEKESSEEKKND